MALQAYPDVPLFRYAFTNLDEGAIAAQLRKAAPAGPQSAAPRDTSLAGKTVRFTSPTGPVLEWVFGTSGTVRFASQTVGYNALTLDHITLFTHLVPETLHAYAVAWDRDSQLATVFELWFGSGPAPVAREVNRAIWHGTMANGPTPAAEALHRPTLRLEGRALQWTEDNGKRTIDYYLSVAYTHWVELDRLKEGRGYSAPADYIQLTEDIYAYTRTEAEFSGLWHMYLMDMNRLEQIGFRLGFNGADELECYMFRGRGEWLGQIARFEAFGETGAEPLKVVDGKKGERRVYRPLATMDKMTPAEVSAVVAKDTHVFDKPSPMAGFGTPPSGALAGRAFAIRYDGGAVMDYRFTSGDTLQWRKDAGPWATARYQAWESVPGVFIFGHLLDGMPDHDGHIVVADTERGMATCFRGYLNTPFIANEAGAETWFGRLVGDGIPDPGIERHKRTRDLLGRCFTWEYSPGLTSMHLYSTPNTVSWIIFTPGGHGGTQWSGSGDFIKIRDQLYFARWQEEACNGTLGTILINMRTMHDAGIGYHCGAKGLSLSAVGAMARHAGKIDIERYFPAK